MRYLETGDIKKCVIKPKKRDESTPKDIHVSLLFAARSFIVILCSCCLCVDKHMYLYALSSKFRLKWVGMLSMKPLLPTHFQSIINLVGCAFTPISV